MAYARILSRLYNTPLAISQDKLDIITSNVTLKLLAGETIPSIKSDMSMIPDMEPETEDTSPTIAVINVFDSLVSRNGAGDSGSTSYEGISKAISRAKEAKASDVVFKIGSPGGEVEGLFGLAEEIYNLRSEGINTHAVAVGNMTSAAYVIGAACETIHATSASIIGSIGVIMTLINSTEADKKQGLSYKIIRSKDEKAMINPHEPFSKKALADATDMLTTLDGIMNETVTRFRPNLSVEKIIDLKGNTVLGEEALTLGLVDNVVTSFQEVIGSIASKSSSKPTKQGANMAATTMTAEEVAALQAQLAEAQSLLASSNEKARAEESTRFNAILATANTLALPNAAQIAQNYFSTGMSASDAATQMQLLKQNIQLANPSPALDALSGSQTPNVAGAVEEPKSYADLIADKIAARSKVKFDASEDSDFEAIESLLQLVK